MWAIEWLVVLEQGERHVPAFEFLLLQPASVRVQLLAIVDAVRTTGPDRWRDTTSHDSMHGTCAQLHEARDRHGQTLYRLYLRWQRNERRVVVINGGTKPKATALPEGFYDRIAALGATADEVPSPFATADDFARIAFELLGDS
jgi:hypothetical protein